MKYLEKRVDREREPKRLKFKSEITMLTMSCNRAGHDNTPAITCILSS